MAWIESHQTLAHHPKTLRLAAELKCGVPAAIGYLHLLWYWALEYAPEGGVVDSQKKIVAQACMWKGEPERFWQGLIAAGFVDTGEQLKIHDWMDYAGRLVGKRAANAERQRAWRTQHVTRDVALTKRVTNGATVPDRTGPNPTVPDPTPPTPPSDQPKEGACCAQYGISGQFHAVSCPAAVPA